MRVRVAAARVAERGAVALTYWVRRVAGAHRLCFMLYVCVVMFCCSVRGRLHVCGRGARFV